MIKENVEKICPHNLKDMFFCAADVKIFCDFSSLKFIQYKEEINVSQLVDREHDSRIFVYHENNC